MLYQVHCVMDPARYPNAAKEMSTFLESATIPSIEMLVRYEKEKAILAGGFLVGEANELILIWDVPSNEELSHMLERLPLWHLTNIKVTPLERLEDRLQTSRKISERLKSFL